MQGSDILIGALHFPTPKVNFQLDRTCVLEQSQVRCEEKACPIFQKGMSVFSMPLHLRVIHLHSMICLTRMLTNSQWTIIYPYKGCQLHQRPNYKSAISSLQVSIGKIACVKRKRLLYTVTTDTPPILGVGRYLAMELLIIADYRYLGKRYILFGINIIRFIMLAA